MPVKIIVKGLASETIVFESDLNECDIKLTVLEFCQKKNIPMASSCFGEGVCKKCHFNCKKIGCLSLLKDEPLEQVNGQSSIIIEIDYL